MHSRRENGENLGGVNKTNSKAFPNIKDTRFQSQQAQEYWVVWMKKDNILMLQIRVPSTWGAQR